MIEIIEHNISKIREACNEHGVVLLQLFGSAARDSDFTERSDIDFLVRFQPLKEGVSDELVFKRVENVDRLREKLETITKRKVDLIEEKSIKNKYLRYFINKDKVSIYGIS